MKTSHWIWRNKINLLAIIVTAAAANWAIQRFHKPGQLDVIAAQAMDMSQMRPPTGVAVVDLVPLRHGSLADTVTYTGSVLPYNEQDISARVTGQIVSLPVYPGDTVRTGQLVAQLDTVELSAKTDQAFGQASEARISEQVALLTHHVHHRAALDAASAQMGAANQGVTDAQDQAQAARDGISDAEAGEQSAKAQADYWRTEIAREKELADAGAASRQEYQNELAQSQAAEAALTQARSKVSEAEAMLASAQAKVAEASSQVSVASSGKRMALADLEVASAQIQEEGANAQSAEAAAREASVVQGYATIVSPANGVVTARPVAPGTLVQPGTVILTISEIDRVRVQANVAVADLAGIGAGSPVELDMTGGSQASISARVTSVFPSADDQTHTAVVEAVVPNPDHRILPGAFVTMRITKSTDDDKTLVPAEAILYEDGQPYVWAARGAESIATAVGATKYRATGCGMLYSAADATKYHYHCPMDHSLLVPVIPAGTSPQSSSAAATGPLTAQRIDVEVGGSDGTWTEITSSNIQPGDQIVRHGQAGLTEGVPVTGVAWGPNGPTSLPTAADVSGGGVRYKCEICGLIFSASDAKKDNYRDPMDGGKFIPIH